MAVVQVICTNLKNNPHCPHGPTLKFVRVQNGIRQEFFACSTYRDRKDCSFYRGTGDTGQPNLEVCALEKKRILPGVDSAATESRLLEIKQATAKDRLYCHSCCQLDLASRRAQHLGHDIQSNISNYMLTHPTQILKPKETSRKEAQYLFADSTTQVIVENLHRAGVKHVLCLGTPRVHECIQSGDTQMGSLLLDIDHRHHSFWPSDKFVWYNMFNRHVLSEQPHKGKHILRQFLKAAGRIALVMDPPFGGHVEPLAATVEYFIRAVAKRKQNEQLLVIWIFPYFRERHITEKCPSLVMLDYKVQYDNHKDFNNGSKGRKLGSPVRLFTNMQPREFLLPEEEGYRLCEPCGRWVAAENRHCTLCNTCPSKDGRTYVHCPHCAKCVKPQWQHCFLCQRCLPLAHACQPPVTEDQCAQSKLPRRKKMMRNKMSLK